MWIRFPRPGLQPADEHPYPHSSPACEGAHDEQDSFALMLSACWAWPAWRLPRSPRTRLSGQWRSLESRFRSRRALRFATYDVDGGYWRRLWRRRLRPPCLPLDASTRGTATWAKDGLAAATAAHGCGCRQRVAPRTAVRGCGNTGCDTGWRKRSALVASVTPDARCGASVSVNRRVGRDRNDWGEVTARQTRDPRAGPGWVRPFLCATALLPARVQSDERYSDWAKRAGGTRGRTDLRDSLAPTDKQGAH